MQRGRGLLKAGDGPRPPPILQHRENRRRSSFAPLVLEANRASASNLQPRGRTSHVGRPHRGSAALPEAVDQLTAGLLPLLRHLTTPDAFAQRPAIQKRNRRWRWPCVGPEICKRPRHGDDPRFRAARKPAVPAPTVLLNLCVPRPASGCGLPFVQHLSLAGLAPNFPSTIPLVLRTMSSFSKVMRPGRHQPCRDGETSLSPSQPLTSADPLISISRTCALFPAVPQP